jgi:hypothetical protein
MPIAKARPDNDTMAAFKSKPDVVLALEMR